MLEEKKEEKPCLCDGKQTIQFRGRGSNLQYMVCSQVGTGEHKTMEECQAEYRLKASANFPSSGRFG